MWQISRPDCSSTMKHIIFLHIKSVFRGSATIELIIVLSAILLIWLGGMDLARVIHAHVAVASAVHTGVMSGARILQQSDPVAWEKQPDGSISILHVDDVKEAMTAAAKMDVGDRYKTKLAIVANEINCRCLKLNKDGVNDSFGNLVACNDTNIINCNGDTTYPLTYRQVFASMRVRLPLDTIFDWPILPNSYDITAAAVMQGGEI